MEMKGLSAGAQNSDLLFSTLSPQEFCKAFLKSKLRLEADGAGLRTKFHCTLAAHGLDILKFPS